MSKMFRRSVAKGKRTANCRAMIAQNHYYKSFYIKFQYGELFLKTCDFMLGSPTALADSDLEKVLYKTAEDLKNGLYVPSGALWGGEDIRKMSERGSLKGTATALYRLQTHRVNGALKSLKTRLKILPVLTCEHYTSLLHWV
jgi:hypothetical protein